MIRLFLNLVVCVALALGAMSCGGAGKRLAKEDIKHRERGVAKRRRFLEFSKKYIKSCKKLEKNFEKLSDDEKDKYLDIMAEYELAEEAKEEKEEKARNERFAKYKKGEEEWNKFAKEHNDSKRLQKIEEKLDELREKREEEEPEEKKLERLVYDVKIAWLSLYSHCLIHDDKLPVGLDDVVDKKIAEQFRMLDLPQKITEIKNPSETVMFVSKKSIRGRFVVGYADGHIASLSESDLPK